MNNKTGGERDTQMLGARHRPRIKGERGGNFAIYLPGKKEKNKSRHHHQRLAVDFLQESDERTRRKIPRRNTFPLPEPDPY
jgi:hypothetical protein